MSKDKKGATFIKEGECDSKGIEAQQKYEENCHKIEVSVNSKCDSSKGVNKGYSHSDFTKGVEYKPVNNSPVYQPADLKDAHYVGLVDKTPVLQKELKIELLDNSIMQYYGASIKSTVNGEFIVFNVKDYRSDVRNEIWIAMSEVKIVTINNH